MLLCHFTLQPPTSIVQAIHGNFSGYKAQEIIVSRGKVLDILKPDPSTGKIHTLLSIDVFACVRSLMAVRLTGASKDYIFVGSDSGRILVLEYNPTKNILEKIHQETFGKTGCRRIVPGQYLAADPKGRAVMIGACEKQKLVYLLNRDSLARLTISSPLEAHKNCSITFHMVGIDVSFENPLFACLELDYEEADNDPSGEIAGATQQTLTFYELDLGLNHVVRKFSVPLEEMANLLISVPGGNDGPGGVLVCSENHITYRTMIEDQTPVRCPIPRRRNDLDDADRQGSIIVCSATHKTRTMFFFLVQTEQGDVFKLTMKTNEGTVIELCIKYFDTLPVAASLCVLRSGFLFVASEFGNHYLYQISHLADDDEEPEFSSAGAPLNETDTFFFMPRDLKNLVLVEEVESLSPIISAHCADILTEDNPQIYTLCGRGPRSSLRVLRHGLECSEMAVSDLPGTPTAIWTVRRSLSEQFDSYIVVSFINATLILSIGETVEEVIDSGFLQNTQTMHCGQIGEDALIQIYAEGIRHVRVDKRVNEWRSPGRRLITKCAVNQCQVAIALGSHELVYFEMDASGQLNEFTERRDMPSGGGVRRMVKAHFLAVGLADKTIRIVSLRSQDCLNVLQVQALPAVPESLCLTLLEDALYLTIGLQNGVLLRAYVDSTSGDLSDTRTRYLGLRSIQLFRVIMQGADAVLALSTRSWLSYTQQSRLYATPLSYQPLDYASGFASEQCPEGIVAITGHTLRILALEKLGVCFNQEIRPLQLTPRRMVIGPASQVLQSAESNEHNMDLAKQLSDAILEEEDPSQFGSAKAAPGMWASCLTIHDPRPSETDLKFSFEFEQNESATCLGFARFNQRPGILFLLVGVSNNLVINPRRPDGGFIYCFQVEGQAQLTLLHKTPLDEVPGAIHPFHGRVLIGVGRYLRIYDLGKTRLLRKCECRSLPSFVSSIDSIGTRIYVGDVQDSVFMLKYRKSENEMIIFADDTSRRFLSAVCLLDFNTLAVADKFGTVAILRLQQEVSDNIDVDPTGIKGLWERGLLNGAPYKLETINSFFVGETVTSLQKTVLNPAGGSECILYTTISGTIGVLVPFSAPEDYYVLQHLEMHMRIEYQTLCGRDHTTFRSYYFPVKSVIDGDLCEKFVNFDLSKQKAITTTFDRTPNE
ncbi:hypothetical protein ACOME3_003928, partial [Neoechinorhynchus agilis]